MLVSGEFNLEVQQYTVWFAPAGRDVYSLAALLAPKLCRSVIASCLPLQKFRCQVSLLTERDLRRALVTINISLLWSENESTYCIGKLNPPFHKAAILVIKEVNKLALVNA